MNNKIVSPSGFIFFLILVAFSLQSCTSPRERSIKQWEKTKWSIAKTDKKEEPTWVIYTRKIADTNFVEYKIKHSLSALDYSESKAIFSNSTANGR